MKRFYINDEWKFSEYFREDMKEADFDEAEMVSVRLPHTCKETPLHYFDEQMYQMECCYRRKLYVQEEWIKKKVFLTLEGAGHSCIVYINGEQAGEHHCGYTACTIEIGRYLRAGAFNTIAIRVDSRETQDIPPFGFVIDYMTYGGLYRDVYLEVREETYLKDVYVHAASDGTVVSEITVNNPGEHLTVKQKIQKWKDGKLTGSLRLLGESRILGEKQTVTFRAGDIECWDTVHPALYVIKTELFSDGVFCDGQSVKTGFRDAVFCRDGFYLNGSRLKIRGMNRHQSYPYTGYAMPESMQRLDADILKYELGVNAVRTSHYPQSHYFLERCDEIGLLVFTEMPGWQHIGGEAWKNQAAENVRDMVKQYRNHPSIVLWGVRINESQDDDAFYERTNRIAHELDAFRQTGGVRAHKKSSLLEDVYTYNDFLHDGKTKGCEKKAAVTPDPSKPYLISEYNGHMYPTKAFDCEEHRLEHALRHARVLDAAAGEEEIAGSFAWCMFDYNTHKDFGSGDRICYHGVMDMFRNPKPAAAVYACQQEERTVLKVSSSMDIGEHPGCSRGSAYLFTNADSVRMYKKDHFIKEYKRSDSPYKNLLHGPILIDDYIGDAIARNEDFAPSQARDVKKLLGMVGTYGLNHLPLSCYYLALKLMVRYHMKPSQAVTLYNRYVGDWGDAAATYRFDAVKNGAVVCSVTKAPAVQPVLSVQADHTTLREGRTYDVAAVRIRAVDENGNLLNYFQEPVYLRAEGPAALIGPSVISLQGGMGGTYLKTLGEEGKVRLTIRTEQTEEVRLEFTVERAESDAEEAFEQRTDKNPESAKAARK